MINIDRLMDLVLENSSDTTALKKALPDVWQSFSKETTSKRFTINAA